MVATECDLLSQPRPHESLTTPRATDGMELDRTTHEAARPTDSILAIADEAFLLATLLRDESDIDQTLPSELDVPGHHGGTVWMRPLVVRGPPEVTTSAGTQAASKVCSSCRIH